ncbi:hypothetical protein [Haloarchaeobius litoreus]|uniref:Uncharacterized protein n=1 Tax=Haloarchaeobius litoreus TaxID=755306 RepID=A0ABD6DRB1_9EURY|nr:hypothetical protein [Haloarchaeobius litoreus]
MDEAEGASDDSMRSRAQESSWKLRVLLEANRWVVAAGIAAFVFVGTVVLGLAGSTLGVADVLLVFALANTVAVVPFAILLAYVLRVATVAKRTLSIGPFILRNTDRSFDFDDA